MALQFYLGRAGSGKTWRCVQEIAAHLREDPTPRGHRLIYLVPEQAAAQSERAILEVPDIRGFARAHIVSFRRLAQMVLESAGGAQRPMLNDEGRLMLLRAVVARHRDKLRLFSRSSRETGFISRLDGIFRELCQFGHSFTDLEARARHLDQEGAGDSVLAMKLHDLSLLGLAWEAEISSRFSNPDHFLDELALRLGQTRFFDKAEVWIDGFAGFTPQERRVIEVILCRASIVHVALLLDPKDLPSNAGVSHAPGKSAGADLSNPLDDNAPQLQAKKKANPITIPIGANEFCPDPTRLFSETEETYLRLMASALDMSIEVLPPVLLPDSDQFPRFAESPCLQLLESNLTLSGFIAHGGNTAISPSAAAANSDGFELPDTPISVLNHIPTPLPPMTCVEAATRREEVEGMARAIRRLCRNEGEQYRSIAVVVRDLDLYHAQIRAAFAAHDIPCFIDRRRTVTHNPLLEILRSSVRVIRDRWLSEDVIQYLKTDLAPVSRNESDLLENYALKLGVADRRWWIEERWPEADDSRKKSPKSDAKKQPKTDVSIENLRKQAFAPLVALERTLVASPAATEESNQPLTAARFVRALLAFLQSLQCAQRIEQWARDARETGQLEIAEEHEQVWDAIMELFEQMVVALGTETSTLKDLADVLETGLTNMTLGLVPPALDQVLVGAVDRSRQPSLNTIFVLGMNDRVFPHVPQQDAILLDSERRILSNSDFELAPPSLVRLFRERLLAYVALTRASKRLWVSYAAADNEGSALQPSAYIRVFEECASACCPAPVRIKLTSDWLDSCIDSIEQPNQAIEGVVRAWGHVTQPASSVDIPAPSVTGKIVEHLAWRQLGDRLQKMPRTSQRLQDLLHVLTTRNGAKLDREKIGSMLDLNRPISVSRLETYAECPFRFFAQYVLQLQEREQFQIQPLDIGNFHHDVLSDIFRILRKKTGERKPPEIPDILGKQVLDWGKVSPGDAEDALEEALELHRADFFGNGPLQESQGRFFVGRSRRVLAQAIRSFIKQGAQDAFLQIAAELDFGFSHSSIPPMKIPLQDGSEISLYGRIDRVDVAIAPDRGPMVRVIDYKSSAYALYLHKVLAGLSLQLPMYLSALGAGCDGRLSAAGAFYMPIAHDVTKTDAPTDAATKQEVTPIRARGVVDEDAIPLFGPLDPGQKSEFIGVSKLKNGDYCSMDRADWLPAGALDRLCKKTSAIASEITEKILGCCIDIHPYRAKAEKPCTYCRYIDLCRVTPQYNKFRAITSCKRSEAIELLK